MTSKFEYIELSSLISEKPRNGLYKKKEFQGKGHRWIKMSEVYGNDFLLAQQTELLDVTESEISRFNCQAGDLLFGRTSLTLDGIGDCLLVGNVDDVPIFESNLFRVRFDSNKAYPLFYFYFFKSVAGKQLIQTIAKQTAATSITSTDFVSLSVPYAPLDRQKEIGDFLFLFDKKCEFNNKANQTLEEMAQAIFKSWFVDFDPVKAKMNGEQPEGMDAATASLFPEKLVESELGLIPEGWEVGDLSDLMDFNPKRTLKKGTVAPYLDMKNMPTAGHLALDIYDREMGSGTKFVNGDALLARITPCLENGKTAFVDFLEDEQVGWGSTEYIVMRSKSDSYKYFSYFMARFEPFRKFAIQSMTGTSGRQRTQAKTAQTMPFVIPPLSILEKFDELITANMKLIKRHGDENKTLVQLRDTLLPKLLSGEIDLDKVLDV
ncbi:restriction endonuclease subunit S [Photobacterium swingsii]|uniref:restriction endonuclease subunit S n=1 Tax=Photobacterium swingsii TaxID=680026 RepID=UPI00352F8009